MTILLQLPGKSSTRVYQVKASERVMELIRRNIRMPKKKILDTFRVTHASKEINLT